MAICTLPDLPFDYAAMEPAITGEILELHHASQVTGANDTSGWARCRCWSSTPGNTPTTCSTADALGLRPVAVGPGQLGRRGRPLHPRDDRAEPAGGPVTRPDPGSGGGAEVGLLVLTKAAQRAASVAAARHCGDLAGAEAVLADFPSDDARAFGLFLVAELTMTLLAEATGPGVDACATDLSLDVATVFAGRHA